MRKGRSDADSLSDAVFLCILCVSWSEKNGAVFPDSKNILILHNKGDPLKIGKIITSDREIRQTLQDAKVIAVLGLSPKPDRDSHKVAKYLKEKGYKIIPVRPGQKEILGEAAVKSLDDLRDPVDIVDVFRNSEQIAAHVPEAIRLKPKVFWMQLGIENTEAAKELAAAGIDVIMNRCTKIEYERLIVKKIIV